VTAPTAKGFNAGREPANKGKKYPPEVLTPDEVRGLIEACSNRAPTGIRNRALIVAMYRGGLRVGETLALRPKDVDTAAGTLTVLHGKGDRRRVVGLDPGAMAIVGRWLDARHTLGSTDMPPCSVPSKASRCNRRMYGPSSPASPARLGLRSGFTLTGSVTPMPMS
jgi:site-specific recombinase XerD